MIKKEKVLLYISSLISPTNGTFFESSDYLSNTLFMCYMGIKAVNFLRTKTSLLHRFFSHSRILSKEKNKDTTPENEPTECNNLDCGLDLSIIQKDWKLITANMSSLPCSTLDCIKEEKEMKKRPNYFIAIQITDPQIHALVEQIQEHLLLQDEHLRESMIPRNTLHVTLMVMHIRKDTNDHERAWNGLWAVHEKYNSIMCKEPLTLEFCGIGHFGNRVLFAKIKQNASYKRLCDLAKSVHNHMEDVGISTTYTREEFKPHLTIAKLSYTKKSLKRIRKIPPSLYGKFIDMSFGSETVKNIQLLRMKRTKSCYNYYSGDEFFFSMNKSISLKELNSLLCIANNKKDIRKRIAKLSRKFLL